MRIWRTCSGLVMLLAVAACGPRVEVLNLSDIPPAEAAAAQNLRVFTIDNPPPTEVIANLGPVEAFSCKLLITDPPASRGNALQQLRYKAYKMGADAVIDVTFDTRGTDAWGTNCWQSVQASGSAVKLKH